MTDLVEKVMPHINGIASPHTTMPVLRDVSQRVVAIVTEELAQWHDKQAAEYNQSKKLCHENGDWHVADMQMAKEEAHTGSASAIRALNNDGRDE